jgi:hypothetical protein
MTPVKMGYRMPNLDHDVKPELRPEYFHTVRPYTRSIVTHLSMGFRDSILLESVSCRWGLKD